MSLPIGSPSSLVAELTKTAGTGAFTLLGGVPRAARFAAFFSSGENITYSRDNGGGLAEFASGVFNGVDTIAPASLLWSTNGGISGSWINWPATGRQYVRALLSPTTGGAAASINGFWGGTISDNQKIARYLFPSSATLPANAPSARIFCDTPASGGSSDIIDDLGNDVADNMGQTLVTALGANTIITNLGDTLVDNLGNDIVDAVGGAPVIFRLLRNGADIGSVTFQPGALVGVIAVPQSQAFSVGDLFEIQALPPVDAGLSGLVWNFPLT